jgi:hypothetical protein
MFFGEDILRSVENNLPPVQWRGYMSKIGRYQGELMNKASVQAEFRKRTQEALKRGETLPSEDWSSMKLLLRELTLAFA